MNDPPLGRPLVLNDLLMSSPMHFPLKTSCYGRLPPERDHDRFFGGTKSHFYLLTNDHLLKSRDRKAAVVAHGDFTVILTAHAFKFQCRVTITFIK